MSEKIHSGQDRVGREGAEVGGRAVQCLAFGRRRFDSDADSPAVFSTKAVAEDRLEGHALGLEFVVLFHHVSRATSEGVAVANLRQRSRQRR